MTSHAAKFFSKAENQSIIEAIKAAEFKTSGEIRVHLESKSSLDAVSRARKIFSKLKMHKTKARNGILFYLATEDRKFAIVGDQGIHNAVGEEFWIEIKDSVLEQFKQGLFAEGLINGIKHAGESLKLYFPYQGDDQNELDDAINIG